MSRYRVSLSLMGGAVVLGCGELAAEARSASDVVFQPVLGRRF